MPAYDICYLDDSGALTYKFSANCDNDQRAKVLAHAMKPSSTKRSSSTGWMSSIRRMPNVRRMEVWNGAALVYARPSVENGLPRFPLRTSQ